MEPKHVARAVWRHQLLAVAVLVVTGAACAAGLWWAPKSYDATAVVSASATTGSTGESLDSLRGSMAELADSEDVLSEVSTDLSEPRSVDDLRRSVSASWVQGTVLLQIDASDSDPEMAAEIANAVASVLPRYDISSGTLLYTTTDPAQPAGAWSSPNLLLGAGVGAALAVLLAVGAAVLRERRTAGLGACAEIEDFLGAPVLASLPRPKDPTNLPALYPGTAPADTFRHLRVALEEEASTAPVSLVVVAGIDHDDTSVWLGANLAISLATVGRRVLLVDGRIGERGGSILAAPETLGLYDLLGGAALDDAVSPGPVDNLSVLPSGDAGPMATASLLESGFATAMADATSRFDVVVVLAPPLESGPDARIMAAGGSLVLSVPETGVDPRVLRRHLSRIQAVGVRLLGVVLIGRRSDRAPAAA